MAPIMNTSALPVVTSSTLASAAPAATTSDDDGSTRNLLIVLLIVFNPVSLVLYYFALRFIIRFFISRICGNERYNQYRVAQQHRHEKRQWRQWAIYPLHKRSSAEEKVSGQAPIPIIGMVGMDNDNAGGGGNYRRGFWGRADPMPAYAPGYIGIVTTMAKPANPVNPAFTSLQTDVAPGSDLPGDDADAEKILASVLAAAQDFDGGDDDDSSTDSGSEKDIPGQGDWR